ncbi:hypothetical protein PFICI_12500 [Pestalotiopsis fici W106-1]|uniref:Chromo domain-containing protein n=1 Tax=Pestalotiopsis fici (strain W106-1 / CGMCC3.15140) TaxID=1229662 RepID=W3WRV6_PESFW|nr:uncharacterized protein PFICI_12500 [Pestalotiopsis fici W106-1]ETS75556.1 hypothetical protein PFICI_12500 [Pestalotiopsis fici W106-1]
MGVEAKSRRRSKRLRNIRRPIHKVNPIQRQSLRIAIKRSLEDAESFSHVGRDVIAIRGSPSPIEDLDTTIVDNVIEVQDLSDLSNGIPSGQPGWYKIRRIVGQRLAYYLVEWEGIDPATGQNFPVEFVYQSDVNGPARREWHALQNAGKLRRARCGTLILEDAKESVVYEEAWKRSIRRSCALS